MTDSVQKIGFQLIPHQTYQASVNRGVGQPSASQISSGACQHPKITETIFWAAIRTHLPPSVIDSQSAPVDEAAGATEEIMSTRNERRCGETAA